MHIREKIDEDLRISVRESLPNVGFLMVGSNPLPVYALIKALQPKKVLLLGTEEVREYVDYIKNKIEKEDVHAKHALCDPADSFDISQKTQDLMNQIEENEMWFSYTAGTKSMSVNGFEAWKKMIGEDKDYWGVYLSPYGPKIHMNNFSRTFLMAPNDDYEHPEISFKDIVQLHLNILKNERCRNDHQNYTLCDLSKNIHNFVSKHEIAEYIKLLPPAYVNTVQVKSHEFDETIHACGAISFLTDKNFKDASPYITFDMTNWAQSVLPESQANQIHVLDDVIRYFFEEEFESKNSQGKKKARISVMKWLIGQWLEVWVAQCLRDSGLFTEVYDSCELWPPKVSSLNEHFKFEVDVCAMRGVTPFVFSCTVENKPIGFNKEKLFEVGQRSRQLGGEHARSAVVCLARDSDRIKKLINEGWEGYNTVCVFGKNDIYEQDVFLTKVKEWVKQLEQ